MDTNTVDKVTLHNCGGFNDSRLNSYTSKMHVCFKMLEASDLEYCDAYTLCLVISRQLKLIEAVL